MKILILPPFKGKGRGADKEQNDVIHAIQRTGLEGGNNLNRAPAREGSIGLSSPKDSGRQGWEDGVSSRGNE